MDAVLFGGAPISDKMAMVDRVLVYVLRFYEGEVNEAMLREWATAAVDAVWGDGPRVTKYVPMLALRDVRSRVISSLEERLAAGEQLPVEAERDLWVWNTQHQGVAQASSRL
jgi:hypothetical protein